MASENRSAPVRFMLRLIQGAAIGAAAILPGISGGVLSVVFGLYRPLMALLACPKKNLKKYASLFLPVAIGWAVGFIGFARLISDLFSRSENVAIWLFVGLIAGTLPGMFSSGSEGLRPARRTVLLAVMCFFAMFGLLLFTRIIGVKVSHPGFFWYLMCGLLWGVSLVVPGFTSSSMLMSMGLFEPLTAGIGALDPGVILPMFLGIVSAALLLARLVNRLFERHYSSAFYAILGIVSASTAAIIPTVYSSPAEIGFCGLAALAGFSAAYLIEKKLAR
ncbi:MAG: DUF368 domain-containing protein [Oscillospiraceae bacterium]|nr:DUF368 domain-containing protein [Oscillospiraceae bacterium]